MGLGMEMGKGGSGIDDNRDNRDDCVLLHFFD